MKKILALAAVAALTAGVSAYAANPFSDVSTDDWAYQAVSDLSDQGEKAIRTAPSKAKETLPVMNWLRSLPASWQKKTS